MMLRLLVFAFLIFVVSGCNRIKYYPDKNYVEVKTLVLAHQAGGGFPNPFQANTFLAAQHSLNGKLNGIEVDIQLSKDRTIWLSHNVTLESCNALAASCFPETKDQAIVNLDSCNGPDKSYSRLEEIFAFMSAHQPDKFISLDVKAWSPCSVSGLDVPGIMNVIGDQIIFLAKKYGLEKQILVESETSVFLDYIKARNPTIQCFLTTLGDFEKGLLLCLKGGYSGLSYKYKFKEEINASHIQLLRKKGLKIQVWTVNDESAIKEVLSINPDFIQTDNLAYFK